MASARTEINHRLSLPRLPFSSSGARGVAIARDPFEPAAAARRDMLTTLVHVRAVILGAHPRALIEHAGKVLIVGAGDRIGSLRVEAITPSSIILSDGTVVPLVEGEP